MHRVTNHCDAQTELFEWTGLQPFHGGDVVTCFDLVGCRERWSHAVGCEVTWGEVMWLVARCHVMWCNLMCLHFMWCDFLCCVMSRNALRCHVMSSHVMSCHLLWSDAVQWDEILWVCDAMWLVAMSRCVVRSGCVGWIGRWSGDPYYTDLLRTTQYYKVLLQHYAVLHSTTPVQIFTTKYYSSTNSVLQSTTPVLLCTTKYYSSTILYYKVLLQYYSVLQSTTPVLLRTTKYYSSTTLYCKVLLQYYSVLQSTTPVLLCTTKYNSSTTLYYKVQLQYYSVLQSTTPVLVCTTPVLLCTTKYYSSTTPYYKVLLQYYAVLQSTTPVLLCTTKYYSSTTLYYTDLLQYNSVLQSTTPVLVCTTKYYSSTTLYYTVLLCTTKYYSSTNSVLQSTTPVLLCTTQIYSSTSLYYKVLLQYYSVLQSTTPVLLLVLQSAHLQGAEHQRHQRHQMMCLPRKVTLMIDPRHIWNVSYNAQTATQNSKKNSPKIVEASIPMRGRFDHDPTMIRTWSDHEIAKLNPSVRRAYFSPLGNAFCIENYNISRSGYLPRFQQMLHLPRKMTLQDHQIVRLPRKVTLMSDVRHIWNVIYNARSNRTHPPTSPNTAPATQNDSHEWCPSHMKRHLQCAEQQVSPSNLTKCCACHEKWHAWLILVTYGTSFTMRGTTGITLQPHQILRLPRKIALQNLRKFVENSWSVNSNARPIRPWSDHELVISHPPVRRGYFWRFGDAFCIENYNISRSGYLPRFHQILCLPRKVTLQHHQMLRLPRKVTLQDHQILPLPRKGGLQDHQMLRLPWKVTLNCYLTAHLLVIWLELWLY